MSCPLFEQEPAWMRRADATVKARPPANVARFAGSRYEGQSGVAPKRPEASRKVSHRSSKRTVAQARYTSSLTMAGVSHQGSLALKKS